jgi:hypothetical protein
MQGIGGVRSRGHPVEKRPHARDHHLVRRGDHPQSQPCLSHAVRRQHRHHDYRDDGGSDTTARLQTICALDRALSRLIGPRARTQTLARPRRRRRLASRGSGRAARAYSERRTATATGGSVIAQVDAAALRPARVRRPVARSSPAALDRSRRSSLRRSRRQRLRCPPRARRRPSRLAHETSARRC